MAELIVKAEYKNSYFVVIRHLMRISFPVWGVLLPIASFFLAMIVLASFMTSIIDWSFTTLSYLVITLTLTILALIVQSISLPGLIVVNKNGINLPFLAGQLKVSRKSLTWTQISHIDVFGDNSTGKQLVFFQTSGPPVKLMISEIKEDDLEPLMAALKLWAGPEKMRPDAIEFKSQTADGNSFTAMWEEELSRRFLPTVFIPLPAGRTLRNGSLKVLRQLAMGGLSAIYLCRENDQQNVVLKESVLPGSTEIELKVKAKEMFEREAKLLSRINHPGIVKVRDYFIEEARHYLVLDYLNGQDLRQLVMQNGPRSEYQTIQMAEQICSVMIYLHNQEPCILHRDLTPDNMVMTNDGSVVIIDFGAANEFLGTATGTLVGKQSYISPEQFRGKASVESDIYSFGCTLYFLLTGKDPEPLSVSHPKETNPHVSEAVDNLVAKCTDLEKEARYASFAEVKAALRLQEFIS